MNDNLHSRPSEACAALNGYGLDLDKINPLGELSFYFGNPSSTSTAAASAGDSSSNQRQQQQQQPNNKRSMDDVLKKLTSKMHINSLPVDESDHRSGHISLWKRCNCARRQPPVADTSSASSSLGRPINVPCIRQIRVGGCKLMFQLSTAAGDSVGRWQVAPIANWAPSFHVSLECCFGSIADQRIITARRPATALVQKPTTAVAEVAAAMRQTRRFYWTLSAANLCPRRSDVCPRRLWNCRNYANSCCRSTMTSRTRWVTAITIKFCCQLPFFLKNSAPLMCSIETDKKNRWLNFFICRSWKNGEGGGGDFPIWSPPLHRIFHFFSTNFGGDGEDGRIDRLVEWIDSHLDISIYRRTHVIKQLHH